MRAKHLGNNHECGAVSGSVSGFMPEVEPGTSHSACSCYYLLYYSSRWCERPFCTQQSKTADVVMCCADVLWLARWNGDITLMPYIFWGWTGATLPPVSQGKQATFTTLLSLPITLGGSKARREKLLPAEDSALPFCESEKKLSR